MALPLAAVPVFGQLFGAIGSLFGGNGPSKARMFLDSQMTWIQQVRQALNQGAFSSDPNAARAVLAELDAREAQARSFEKTALIEAGRGGGHPWFAEVAALRADLTAAVGRAQQALTYGGVGVGVVVVGIALVMIFRKRGGG